ncbi:hypothetical protein K0M31_017864 [Melipona bicolor]|uniref:Uncharacterized protein n=1 Tax=Melipona bicolor TaxID=60889 RepID=A0AA40G5X0_9HYME|nr:hypothetical protein K0M31_017864 [Melipona bicolor]
MDNNREISDGTGAGFPDERNGLVGRINVETEARARLGATNERDKGNRTAERSGQIGLTTM